MKLRPGWLLVGIAASFWFFLVAYPLAALALRMGSIGSVAAYFDPEILGIAAMTLEQAVWSTVISCLIGLPLGLWIGAVTSREGGRVARLSFTLLSLPYGVPTVVAATVWVSLLGRSGVIQQLFISLLGFSPEWIRSFAYSLKAVVLAHVFYNVPWVALLVAQARMSVPPVQLAAAETLGAGLCSRTRFIIWPQVKWAFASAAAQVMALCVMSFALVLILGGGPPVQTLETALYARIRYGALDVSGAVVCAFWELIIAMLPWLLILLAQSRQANYSLKTGQTGHAGLSPEPGRELGQWRISGVLGAITAFFFLIPYFTIFGIDTLKTLFNFEVLLQISRPLQLSMLIAVLTSLGAVLLGLLCVVAAGFLRFRPLFSTMFSVLAALPSGLSILVLGLGFWVGYARWLDPFAGSLAAMVFLQIAVFYPVAFRILWPVMERRPLDLLDAAYTMGASRLRAFWSVEWPLWRGPVASAIGIVAGASLGEVAAVSLFYSERLVPLPLVISRWMSQYQFAEAEAVSALLLLLSTGIIGCVSYWGQGGSSVVRAR